MIRKFLILVVSLLTRVISSPDVLSEIFARMFKSPATVFLIIGIVPLVPGGGLYYTMDALIDGNMDLFVQKGLEAASIAGAIAAGSSLVSSVVRILPRRKRLPKNGI